MTKQDLFAPTLKRFVRSGSAGKQAADALGGKAAREHIAVADDTAEQLGLSLGGRNTFYSVSCRAIKVTRIEGVS